MNKKKAKPDRKQSVIQTEEIMERRKLVYEYYFLMGRTQREIAEALQCSATTVNDDIKSFNIELSKSVPPEFSEKISNDIAIKYRTLTEKCFRRLPRIKSDKEYFNAADKTGAAVKREEEFAAKRGQIKVVPIAVDIDANVKHTYSPEAIELAERIFAKGKPKKLGGPTIEDMEFK